MFIIQIISDYLLEKITKIQRINYRAILNNTFTNCVRQIGLSAYVVMNHDSTCIFYLLNDSLDNVKQRTFLMDIRCQHLSSNLLFFPCLIN